MTASGTGGRGGLARVTVMIFVIHGAWLLLRASIAPLLRSRRWSRVIDAVLAATFVVATVPALLP